MTKAEIEVDGSIYVYLGRAIVKKDNLDAKLEWFNDSLGYYFDGCSIAKCKGSCCKGLVNLYFSEMKNFIGFINYSPKKGYYLMKEYGPGTKCVFQEEGACTIYEKRPLLCRTFPLDLDPVEINGRIEFYITPPDQCGVKFSELSIESSQEQRIKSEKLNKDILALTVAYTATKNNKNPQKD